MKESFVLLTNSENEPILVGLSNIAMISPEHESGGSLLTFNFARGRDSYPKKIIVKETFDKITKMVPYIAVNQ